MTRLLGLDLGERRIGVAVGDTATAIARGLVTLARAGLEEDARHLARLTEEQRVEGLVIGLPLLPSGTAGEQASATQAWGDVMGERLGLPVTWQDERFTSVAAEAVIGPARRGHAGAPPGRAARERQRAAVDREAARRILQAALDARVVG